MKTLDIIIPRYREDITNLLNCINNQKNVDFSLLTVYVIEDCPPVYVDISNLKLNYKLIIDKTDKNSGPGVARQKGIDISNGEWILFIDADDLLFDENSLKKFWLLDGDNTDIIYFKEYYFENKKTKMEGIPVWNIGKFYKRKTLKELDIYYHPKLRTNEDVFFSLLLKLYDIKESIINDCIYIYKDNKESITRKDNEFFQIEMIYSLIPAIRYFCYEGYKRKILKYQEYIISYFITIVFCFFNNSSDNKCEKKHLDLFFEEMTNWYKEEYLFFTDKLFLMAIKKHFEAMRGIVKDKLEKLKWTKQMEEYILKQTKHIFYICEDKLRQRFQQNKPLIMEMS